MLGQSPHVLKFWHLFLRGDAKARIAKDDYTDIDGEFNYFSGFPESAENF
jgi:hypothetical protein